MVILKLIHVCGLGYKLISATKPVKENTAAVSFTEFWLGDREYQILVYIFRNGLTTFRLVEVSRGVNLDPRRVYDVFQRLCRRGILRRVARGVYTLATDISKLITAPVRKLSQGKLYKNEGTRVSYTSPKSQPSNSGTRVAYTLSKSQLTEYSENGVSCRTAKPPSNIRSGSEMRMYMGSPHSPRTHYDSLRSPRALSASPSCPRTTIENHSCSRVNYNSQLKSSESTCTSGSSSGCDGVLLPSSENYGATITSRNINDRTEVLGMFFDNVRGYVGGSYVPGDRGFTLSWRDLSFYSDISYAEVGYKVSGVEVPGMIAVYTNYSQDGSNIVRVEYRPPKGYVKKNGVESVVRMYWEVLLNAFKSMWVLLTREAPLHVTARALRIVGF